MRIAALFDIHGNLPALEAVLAEVARERVDRIVIGGDIVLGPMSREALDRVAALDVPVDYIHGNCETAVLAEHDGATPKVPPSVRETVRWTAGDLRADQIAQLRTWPLTLRHHVSSVGDVLFCHATPRDDNEIFTARTPDDRLRAMLAGVKAAAIVCGHTHMSLDRRVDDVRVLNAGSVGMPFGPAGADWLLLGPGVEFRHTYYDLAAAAERIRATGYPQAEQFASIYVLNPPSAEQMLAAFSPQRAQT